MVGVGYRLSSILDVYNPLDGQAIGVNRSVILTIVSVSGRVFLVMPDKSGEKDDL